MSLASSGLVTALLLAVVLAVLGVVWKAHMRGKIHKMTTPEILPETALAARPGGQDIVRMIRNEHASEMAPQFSSALWLPGVGMALLQANLSIPGRGQIPILIGTDEAALSGQLDPVTFAPRAGLQVSPISVRVQAPNGTDWGPAMELVMNRPAQTATSDFLPDGSTASAIFAAAPPAGPDGHAPAPSGIETKIVTTITGRGLELNIAATNQNDTPRALVVEWQAHFAAAKSGLSAMSVLAPATVLPSATATTAGHSVPLGERDVHEVFTGLKYSYLSQGPEMQVRNEADGYVLRLTAMTPSICSMRVDAAKDGQGVVLAFSTSAGGSAEKARTVVAPHETLQWRIRVDAPSDAGNRSSAQ